MNVLSLLLFLVYFLFGVDGLGFTFIEYGNGNFTIYLVGNRPIIQHSARRPFVYIGSGETEFREKYGNYKIADYTGEKIGLSSYTVTNDSRGYNLTLYSCSIKVFIRLGSEEGHVLTIDIGDVGSYNRVWIQLTADTNEAIYGGGEQYSYLNLRGRQYPIWTGEQGIGRNRSTLVTYVTDLKQSGGDYYTTYFPQPTFYSTNKYYFHHSGSNYAVLDFSHPNFHEIFIARQPGRLYFNTAETFPLMVSKLTNFLGRMPNLPDWIHDGAIIGVQGGSKQMMDYISYSETHGLNITGVWIQDWAGSVDDLFGHRLFWNWEWNQELYPGLDELIIGLRDRNIHVLAYVNPYLTVDGNLFKYAEQLGYFVKNSTDETYIQDFAGIMAGSIDLTNPAAYQWYKNKIIKENMIEFGMSGWMADFSEYLPVDAKLYNNQSATSYHNIWPVLWAKLNREAVEELEMLGKIVFFLRAGFSGTGKYSTLMWAGDQDVDFTYADGIASTIPAALNMGLSGVGITHFDIGGYTTFAPLLVRREELLLRSAEYAAFGPVFRTHQGNQPKENVQFYSSPEISNKFARLTQIFKTLKNYTKIVLNDTVTSGVPAYKPLFFNYPDDVRCYNVTYQFLYGDDLLIAPVILDFRKRWDVYLPADPTASWVHIWTGQSYQGPRDVTVQAPVGNPPVFYRSTSQFVDIFKTIGNL